MSPPRRENRPRIGRSRPAALLATAAVVLMGGLGACGGGDLAAVDGAGSDMPATMTKATLVLDFVPNAVHAGIYRALAAGYYRDRNVDLRVVQPTSTADTLKLIDAGKADFGIADPIDVATQIARGRQAKAFLALVQRPLGGVITLRAAHIRTPAGLAGRTVGVTGVPSDQAVLRTILASGGLETSNVRQVTVGFNGVQNLEHGRLDAFVGFYPSDGVQAAVDGFPVRSFPFDEHGGPRYPGLVVFSTVQRMESAAPLLRAFTEATIKGYTDTLADPGRSLDDLLAANPTLKRRLAAAQLDAYTELFQAGAPRFGAIDRAEIAAMLRFARENEIVRARVQPARLASGEFLPGA